jgi:chemotaxis signal transduction protein
MSLRGRHARTVSAAPTVRFLLVTAGGTHFALPADRIQGLLTREEAGSAGPVSLQNATYPAIDLAGRLGLAQDAEGPDARTVLLSHGTAKGNIRVAEVHGLKELEQSHVLPLPRHFQGEERTWYEGMVLFEETMALVLNPVWLLQGCGTGQVVAGTEQRGMSTLLLPARPALAGGQA